MNRPAPGGDDVGGLAALGDDAVHLVAGASCWRSRPMATWATTMASPALTPRHGAAEAWAARPGEGHVEVVNGQARGFEALGRPGMDHHRRVDVVEDAGLQHEDLAATSLLGRSAQHPHGETELVGHPAQGRGQRRRPWRR